MLSLVKRSKEKSNKAYTTVVDARSSGTLLDSDSVLTDIL